MGREVQAVSWFSGGVVNSAGYPGDKPFGTMWRMVGPTSYATNNRVFYNGTLDVWPGQSGSAMYRFDGTNRYINSIVHWQYSDYNASVRIDQDKYDRIITWMNEDNTARPPTDRADLVDYDNWFNTTFAYFSPATVRPGQSLTTRAVVRNNGTANAGSFRVTFYASTDTTITSSDYSLGFTTIASLNSFNWVDAIQSANVPTNIPAGAYYVGWIIDSLNQVPEFDESNNTGVITSSRVNILPNTVTGLGATPINASQINLNWNDVAGETGYRIERSPDNVNWSLVTTVGANVVSYSNTGLAAGTLYYYRVAATTAAGQGNYSAVVNATTFVAAPASLTATAAASYRINLSWANITGETGFRVERSPDNVSWSQIAQVGADVTTYADQTGLALNTRYYYRVRGYNVSGNGAYSPTANTLTLNLGSFLLTGAPTAVTAGASFSFTVTARDTAGNVATNYLGTVTFSSTDPVANLPPDTTFTAANAGVRLFTSMNLYVAGPQTVTVRSTALPTIFATAGIQVNFAAPYYYYVYLGDSSLPPPTVTRNVPFAFYILPFDEYFNWITNYAGRIDFWSYDPLAVYPASYTFNGTEGGIGVPGTARFGTLGIQDLWVYNPAYTAIGLGLYNVIGPDSGPGRGGPPGGEGPESPDLIDALAPPARPELPGRLGQPLVPGLDLGALQQLFSRSEPPLGTPAAAPLAPESSLTARTAHQLGDELFDTL